MRAIGGGSLVVAVVSVVGCHLIFPHSAQPVVGDGPTTDARPQGGDGADPGRDTTVSRERRTDLAADIAAIDADAQIADIADTRCEVSINNCGSCGKKCTAPANGTPTCTSSTCGFVCQNPSYPNKCTSPDGCYNFTNDVSRCGSCTTVCPAPVSGASTGSAVCTPRRRVDPSAWTQSSIAESRFYQSRKRLASISCLQRSSQKLFLSFPAARAAREMLPPLTARVAIVTVTPVATMATAQRRASRVRNRMKGR